MPDKQNENKFMAMLERKGIVRKADSEDVPTEPGPAENRPRPEVDLRSLFGTPDGEITNITPAARQPVPGMSTPIFPAERQQTAERVEPRPIERVVPLQSKPFVPLEPETQEPEEREPIRPIEREQPRPVEREQPRPVEREQPRQPEREQPRPFEREQPRPVGVSAPVPLVVSVDPFKEEPAKATPYNEDKPVAAPPPVAQPEPPPAENYTERYLEIDELYEKLSVRSKRTDTIYLVEEYLKTLPDSLPEESRREIVSRIISASGFDYDLLMGDGVLRVKMLKEYAERFARHTDDYVTARQAELDELDQQILRVRRLIENRRELHKKQFFAIEAEAQRLKEILSFISG